MSLNKWTELLVLPLLALAVLSLVTVLPLWLLSLVVPSLRGLWAFLLMLYVLTTIASPLVRLVRSVVNRWLSRLRRRGRDDW